MIVVPTIPLLFATLQQLRELQSPLFYPPKVLMARLVRGVAVAFIAIYVTACLAIYGASLVQYFHPVSVAKTEAAYRAEVLAVDQLQSHIPESERASFMCWGNFYSTSHWILLTGMKPRERFFTNNTDLSLLDPSLKEEWLSNIRQSPPLWILYGTNKDEQATYRIDEHRGDPDVERLLAEKYTLCDEALMYDQRLRLYRLKEQ